MINDYDSFRSERLVNTLSVQDLEYVSDGYFDLYYSMSRTYNSDTVTDESSSL